MVAPLGRGKMYLKTTNILHIPGNGTPRRGKFNLKPFDDSFAKVHRNLCDGDGMCKCVCGHLSVYVTLYC